MVQCMVLVGGGRVGLTSVYNNTNPDANMYIVIGIAQLSQPL